MINTNLILIAAIIFVITYVIIMSEKINRAVIALLSAGIMIIIGVIDQSEAIKGIDFNTIGLLIGMMIIVAITKQSGMFQYMAIWSAKKVNASPWGILIMISIVTAITSAFLDNVTTVLLIVPITLSITKELGVEPYPYLFSMIFSSNIGGTATLIGDPPNIMIGSATGLSFNDFTYHLLPVILIIMISTIIAIYFIWGRNLRASIENRKKVMNFKENETIENKKLLKQCLLTIISVILLFTFSKQLNLEAASISIFCASVLLLLSNLRINHNEQNERISRIFNEIEWITIFFFIGLFVIVHGLEKTGLLKILANKMLELNNNNISSTAISILWSSAILSAVIDNIPFVATMIPMIKNMSNNFGNQDILLPLWWSLSLGACLGGNGTLIGASANLVVAGFSEKSGYRIKFIKYTLLAFPMMLFSILICTFYIKWRYL